MCSWVPKPKFPVSEKLFFFVIHTLTPLDLFQDFFCLGPTDCAVDGNLFISSDAKGADGVSGFGEHGDLAWELLQDLGWLSQQSFQV